MIIDFQNVQNNNPELPDLKREDKLPVPMLIRGIWIMNEVSYVVEGFEHKFAPFKGKKIILHGSREYARAIIERFDPVFHFDGVISFDRIESGSFQGLPVFQQEELPELQPDLIILTERVKYAEEAYCSLRRVCRKNGIAIYNMYGLDEVRLHHEAEKPMPENLAEWANICAPYDRVVFEVVDTLLRIPHTGEKPMVKQMLQELIVLLRGEEKSVGFSLRKSVPEELQIQMLRQFDLVANEETELIHRRGEDLSFRALREAHPMEKILYIGNGLVNEFILPQCYGIDARRIGARWELRWEAPKKGGSIPKPFQPDLRLRIKAEIQAHANISFDVFDTLLVRKTLLPSDVFSLTEIRAKQVGLELTGFAEARQWAERDHAYADLNEIYEWLEDRFDWDEETAQQIKEIELSVERDVLFPRTEVVELFHFAKREGKRVFLTSDMYLPEPVLRSILESNGITGYDRLLVSCDCGKAKQSGLYEELIALCGEPGSILHIGDDAAADGMASEAAGISSVVLPSALQLARERGWASCIRSAQTLMERCLVGAVTARLFRDPFQNPNLHEHAEEERMRRYGTGVVGPLMAGYMTWLLSKLQENKFNGVLFLARDGYLPIAIYNSLRERMHLPEAIYYYANRRSAFLCNADSEDQTEYITERVRIMGFTARETVQNIYRIPEQEVLPLEKDETIPDYIDRHMPVIQRIAEESRQGYRRYSERCGMQPGGKYAVVDFVATGTTQMYLQRFLPYRLQGYYFGEYWPPRNDTEYYLRKHNLELLINWIEMESYITSPEPSQDYMKGDGTIIFSEEVRSPQELQQFRMVSDAALCFAKDFFQLFYQEGEVISPAVAEEMYAADGYHWVQQHMYDDWFKVPIKMQGEEQK